MSSNQHTKQQNETRRVASTIKEIDIEQPRVEAVAVEIEGVSDLIQNNFSQKSIEEMLRKHMGLAVQREKKNPRECIERATIYNTDGKVCIPPTAFKKAMLTAATQVKTLKKTQLRIQLYVAGNSIPITYKKMVPRMDMVRTSGMSRTPDVRFRPSFQGWKARMLIQYSQELQAVTVVDLLQRAGNCGVGEWRPEKDGTYGTFRLLRLITDPSEVAEVQNQCSIPLRPITVPSWALDANLDPQILEQIASGKGDGEEAPHAKSKKAKPRR